MDKPPVIGCRHYNPAKSNEEVLRLRAIEREQHEAYIQQLIDTTPAQQIDYPVPAIRAWYLNGSYHQLRSLAFQYTWESPVERIKTSISKRGTTGFWAVKPHYVDYLLTYNPTVIGIVELTGIVVEHEHGWRGEICTIVELFHLGIPESVPHLERRYQCDVTRFCYTQLIQRLRG